MPIDASIYGNLKPIEMPSMLESQTRAMNLSSLAMQQNNAQLQQAQAMKQMEKEDKDAQYTDHVRKVSLLGGALDSLDGMKEEDREIAYPRFREQLISSGSFKPQDIPEQYDRGLTRQYSYQIGQYRQSKEYLEKEKTVAEILKLKAEASRKGTDDPLARQMAVIDYRDKIDQGKKDRELAKYTNMGGWNLKEGATPTLDDAKKFKTGVSAARSLLDNLNEYQTLISNKGAELAGKDSQRMESLARDIQLTAKNEDLYGLGVLTGPDLMLLEELIKAPTGAWDAVNPWAGSKAVNKAQQFREMLNTRINAKAKTYGFEPQPEWSKLASGGNKVAPKSSGSGTTEAYAADSKPKVVYQNGHAYELNTKTGKYE